jgi:hypothetical protein
MMVQSRGRGESVSLPYTHATHLEAVFPLCYFHAFAYCLLCTAFTSAWVGYRPDHGATALLL